MENKKAVLITIVVLLLIFTPLTVIGGFARIDKNPLDPNPSHEFSYKGKLWFYNENDKLMSKYECQTDICELSTPTISDDTYGINYYKDGDVVPTTVIDNKYAFITDGTVIHLFSTETGTSLQTYNAIKNYNTTLENNTFIIQNTKNLWGALTINDTLGAVLPFEYDFIGLKNEFNENNSISTDKFIVLKDSKWFLVDNNNSAITGYVDYPIVDYTDNYIITKTSERVRVYSYDNREFLTNYRFTDYVLEDEYVGLVTGNFLLIYNNLDSNYLKSVNLANRTGEITLEKQDNILYIKVNGNVIDNMVIL